VRFTGTRRSDFSREHPTMSFRPKGEISCRSGDLSLRSRRQSRFATKVAPADNRIRCVPCASARKQDVELPAKTGFSVICKPATTVRSSLNYYNLVFSLFAFFALFADNIVVICVYLRSSVDFFNVHSGLYRRVKIRRYCQIRS
jgi:hypothetical protein